MQSNVLTLLITLLCIADSSPQTMQKLTDSLFEQRMHMNYMGPTGYFWEASIDTISIQFSNDTDWFTRINHEFSLAIIYGSTEVESILAQNDAFGRIKEIYYFVDNELLYVEHIDYPPRSPSPLKHYCDLSYRINDCACATIVQQTITKLLQKPR